MSRRGLDRLGPALLLVLLTLAANAVNAAVILVDEERRVRSDGTVRSATSFESWSVEERSPGTFGAFDAVVDEARSAGLNTSSSSASLQSSIADDLLSASALTRATVSYGESTGSYGSLSGNALSEFEVTFQVIESTLFQLTGALTLDQILGSPRGTAQIMLTSASSVNGDFRLSFGSSYAYSDFSQMISIGGILEPNTYTLRATASITSDTYQIGTGEEGFASFDVNLALGAAAVPLPAAAWLFGLALAMLGGLRVRLQPGTS